MKSRRNIKVTTDMFEDTKFKIIDTKPERDLIHYVWFRMLTLAGKVNRNGDLYLSSNIPYTLETLAIEFNRDAAEIKYALGVLTELEMICRNESGVYSVKNFAKHQNIKIEETIKETEGIKVDNYKDSIRWDNDGNEEIDTDNYTNNIVSEKGNELNDNLMREKIIESKNDNKKDDEPRREKLSKDDKSINKEGLNLDELQIQESSSCKEHRKSNSKSNSKIKKKKKNCHLTKEDDNNEIVSIEDEKDIGDLGRCISCWTF